MMAIDLNDQYIKAFIANGQSLIMIGQETSDVKKCEKGIERLRKALQLTYKMPKIDQEVQDKINQQMFRAGKIKYFTEKKVEEAECKQAIENLTATLKGNDAALKDV